MQQIDFITFMFIGHEKIYDVSFSNVSLWVDMQDLCQIRVIEVFKHASWNYDYWHKYVLLHVRHVFSLKKCTIFINLRK